MNRSQTVLASLCLALSVVGSFVGFAAAQAAQSNGQQAPLLSAAEFPDYDASVWREQRTGLAAKVATNRLAQQPESPEITELLQQNRVDDALRVVRAIIDKHPEQIPRAFEIVFPPVVSILGSGARLLDRHSRTRQAPERQLPRLPKEKAARAERQLLIRTDSLPVAEPLPFADELKCVVEQYPGTETALLTEIDVIEFDQRCRFATASKLDKFLRDHSGTIAAAKALHLKGFQLGATNVAHGIRSRGPIRRIDSSRSAHRQGARERPRIRPVNGWTGARAGEHVLRLEPDVCDWKRRSGARRLQRVRENALRARGSISAQHRNRDTSSARRWPIFSNATGKAPRPSSVLFAELEADTSNVAGVQYLQAEFYMRSMNSEPAAERPRSTRRR